MPSRKAEKREYRLSNAAQVAKQQSTFTRTTFKVPAGVNLFWPKKDKTEGYEIDIIPYQLGKKSKKFNKNLCSETGEPGDWHYERTYFAHAKVGTAEEWAVCPKCTFGNPCVGCDQAADLRKQDPNNRDVIGAVKAKRRQLFLIYDHNDPKKGVQIWEEASFNFGENLNFKINTARPENRKLWEKFHDPSGGYTLRIVPMVKKVGKGENTVWMVDEFIPRKNGIPDELMDHGICLDDIITELSSEEFEKLYTGEKDEDAEGAEEEPARGGKKADDDDDDDDDDDPDEKPARGRRVKEEDEDDKPARGSRKSRDEEDDETEEPVKRRKLRDPENGDKTSFTYRGKRYTGTITKVKGDVVYVDVGDMYPMTVELDDLDEPDEKPARSGGRKSRDDDDDSDDTPARGKTRKSRTDDDDDEPVKDDGDDDDDTPRRRRR